VSEVIESFGLTNCVHQATHDRGGSLDVVLTRCDLPPPATVVIDMKNNGLSDHSMIKWTTNLNAPPPLYETVNRCNWKNFRAEVPFFGAGLAVV
jgi:hypothetical protein